MLRAADIYIYIDNYRHIYILYTCICKLNHSPVRGAPSSKSRQQLQWIVFVFIGLDTQSQHPTTAARRARCAHGDPRSTEAAGLSGSRGATVAAIRRSTQFRQIFAKHLFGADRGLGRTCNRTKWKSRKTTESTHRCFGIENFIKGLCSRYGAGSRRTYEWRGKCHRAKLQTFQKGGHSNTGPKGHSTSGDCPCTSWYGSLTSRLTDWVESQLDCTGSLEWTNWWI